jgi:hypothetical protein
VETAHRVAMDQDNLGVVITLHYHICKRSKGFQQGDFTACTSGEYDSSPVICAVLRRC